MKASAYLDALQQKLGVKSDYALMKHIGVSKQSLSKYRQDMGGFDDEVCIRVAEILGMHPAAVMLDMHKERSKTPEVRALWEAAHAGFWQVVPRANDRRRTPRPVM